jgi:hypothetical protein
MQKIKKRKATDGTGMAGELYKAGGDWMTTHLVEKFNNVLESGVAPDLWKPVLFSMLHKDGDRGLIKNYRPLALLPLSYKIFATAILEKIRGEFISRQAIEQAAFQTGVSLEDNLVILQIMLEQCEDYGTEGFIVPVDYAKAFDSVDPQYLAQTLIEEGFPPGLVELLVSIQCNQEGRVKGQNVEDTFVMGRGIRQGDPLSPVMFNLVLKRIFKKVSRDWELKGYGMWVGGALLTHLCYADDVLIFRQTHDSLRTCSKTSSEPRGKQAWR